MSADIGHGATGERLPMAANDITIPRGCTVHLGPGNYGTVRVEGHLASVHPDARIHTLLAGGEGTRIQPAVCANCRHWAVNRSGADLPRTGPYACKNPKLAESFDFAEPADMAHADDGIGILTGPQFGCIHWEAKT